MLQQGLGLRRGGLPDSLQLRTKAGQDLSDRGRLYSARFDLGIALDSQSIPGRAACAIDVHAFVHVVQQLAADVRGELQNVLSEGFTRRLFASNSEALAVNSTPFAFSRVTRNPRRAWKAMDRRLVL